MRPFLISALLVGLAAFSPAQAGQSYDNCTGFIDSLPATITTQGVWCLRADLSTAISTGNAITVGANNITIDCNHFKLGGLAAGPASLANGIRSQRINTTVRNCHVRGFHYGVYISSDGGNLVESNRLDGNLNTALFILGQASVVRDNQVLDTGGSTQSPSSTVAIHVGNGADVVGNFVHTVFAVSSSSNKFGIYAISNDNASIRANRIKGLVPNDSGAIFGMFMASSPGNIIRDNDLQGAPSGTSVGIRCTDASSTARDNVLRGFDTGTVDCTNSGNTVNVN